MITINGFQEVNAFKLSKDMTDALNNQKVRKVDIAYKLRTTTQTIDNAFTVVDRVRMKAADRTVCKVAKYLGLHVIVVENEKKQYFINYKK